MLYDASRLSTRAMNATPNGIDRIDAFLARALLSAARGADGYPPAALMFGFGGPRVLPARDGIEAVERAEKAWGESDRATVAGRSLAQIRAMTRDPEPVPAEPRTPPLLGGIGRRIRAGLGALRRFGPARGFDPVAAVPRRSVLLNASHFPLEWPGHVAWLDRRPDVRLLAFVHDLLPLDHPDLFWRGEPERHRARLALLARRGAGAIVTTQSVAERLRDELARTGRRDFPVLQAFPPVDPLFRRGEVPPRLAARRPYFVACGTIEPRKNHALLLRVWRRLVAASGSRAPGLVIVGKRGWLCGSVVRAMAHPALAGHVVEASAMSSRAYRALLDGSVALLAPSLAEGFGLPLAEALSAGVPVVASDIAPFREQAGASAVLLPPSAEDLWLEAVEALARAEAGGRREEALSRAARHRPVAASDYVGAVSRFIGEIAA